MSKFPSTSLIKGFLFSALDKFGPMPKYAYPEPVSENEKKNSSEFNLTFRDYTQISIKNLSLLMNDKTNIDDKSLKDANYFAILPYPDYKITSLTYFHFIWLHGSSKPVPTAFSLLVEERKRNFLYNNIDKIKALILESFTKLDDQFAEGFVPYDKVQFIFEELINALLDVEKRPSYPITAERKLKIIFFGLDSAGKTSFFLTIDRRFSRLIGVKPTRGEKISTIQAVGATISLWDLGGQLQFREKYIKKSEIYLYEADLMFYFIDVQRKDRFKESIQYLKTVKKDLEQMDQITPVIYVLTKADPDIIDTPRIQENIKEITTMLTELNKKNIPEINVTSIFSLYSVLRAFSSGISKLSPNRALIGFNLRNFSVDNKIALTLLLSYDGLLLADYVSQNILEFKAFSQVKENETDIKNVFEVTAPQFTNLFKIFEEFKSIKEKEAIFKIADAIVLFKRVIVDNQEIFLLFLIDDESSKEQIKQSLPEFLSRNSTLISRYIS